MKRTGLERMVLAVALACCLLATGIGSGAAAQTGQRQSAEVRFVEQRPGVPSALAFEVDYVNPGDPNAKPAAVRTVVETLAKGASFDTSVPEQCEATDAQLVAQGESACPPESRVGAGYIRIDTGFPEPNRFIEVDVVFFNNHAQLIFLNTVRGAGSRVVSRAAIEGGKLTTNAPTLPGTPPDGAAIDVVSTKLEAISRTVDGERRGYVMTPPSCPRSGEWVSSLRFTYADGVSQQVDPPSPCREAPAAQTPGRCAASWRGSGGSDRHVGTVAGDRLLGLGAADRLRGRRGRDCLHGHQGPDVLRGGSGADRLRGGPGRDVCRGGRGRDQLIGCEIVRGR